MEILDTERIKRKVMKNKIIDKALEDIEIKKERDKIEERKKTHTFMESFFGPDYRDPSF